MFARLGDGVEAAAAERELSALTAADAQLAPAGSAPLTSARLAPLTGLPGGEAGPIVSFMGLLLGAAGLVLMIAGVNVAAMLSARSLARRREMAVRAALGAGRGRLLRQLMTEILLLFLLGGLGGILVASLATAGLERLPLPVNVPLTIELSPDWRVLIFALCTALATGGIFGLAPALQSARRDLTSRLRDDGPATGPRRTFMSRTLIVGQLALSLVLLVGAGLFMRALDRGQRIDPGFDASGIVTADLEPEAWGYDEARTRVFYDTLRERLAAIPGVTAVSASGRLPLMMGSSIDDITVDGAAAAPIHMFSVDAGYFDVLRLPILKGRALGTGDGRRAPKVAVVNETMARRFWPDGSAVGRSFGFRGDRVSIVGIARDAKYATLDETTPPFAYFPLAQWWQPNQSLLVRTAGAPESFAGAVQQAVRSIDAGLPRPRTTTLEQATAIALFPQRVAAVVTGVLGVVGLLLATVGLYGVTAYAMNRRTREIGIRVALGARRSNVLGMVLREGMRLAGAGIVVGLALAAAVTRLMAGFLFGVSPLDAVTFIAMSVLFLAVALIATYLPARRAAHSDPLLALRSE
jgi:predicted permease